MDSRGGATAGRPGLGNPVVSRLLGMASLNRAPVQLKCFAVRDAIESPATMQDLFIAHEVLGTLSPPALLPLLMFHGLPQRLDLVHDAVFKQNVTDHCWSRSLAHDCFQPFLFTATCFRFSLPPLPNFAGVSAKKCDGPALEARWKLGGLG